ncbi:MAG: MaoC family dehydratase [Betaproteobacteria bacterium]|nr:MAG: MaoC family dehydratase [Betaproteobacteria bacterium]TMH31640.1 MAG: MaoC family dehydratase [Betaproteobacteria bacterium]
MCRRPLLAEPDMTPETPASDSTLLYWEDFREGEVREFGQMSVKRDDIVRFAAEFDPQPFHLDEAAAAQTMFGGLIASGWHTAAMAMRMMCDEYLLRSASLGSPGLETLKWLQPVRPGDTLHTRLTILETRPLQSRPGVGLLKSRHEVLNQRGETVMLMEGFGMMRRRPAA